MRRLATWATAAAIAAGVLTAAPGRAETPSLPVFTPHPSDWSPDYTVFPYNLWQMRVTPEQVTALRESCQWFNAQFDTLMAGAHGFQNFLDQNHDVWSTPGVQSAAGTVVANLDQSAAFLEPRVHTLYITNYPDHDEYSPLYHGDSFFSLWNQLTGMSDKIRRKVPSGQINANVATADVYGYVIRNSGVCEGA